jgi:hypothetical protein
MTDKRKREQEPEEEVLQVQDKKAKDQKQDDDIAADLWCEEPVETVPVETITSPFRCDNCKIVESILIYADHTRAIGTIWNCVVCDTREGATPEIGWNSFEIFDLDLGVTRVATRNEVFDFLKENWEIEPNEDVSILVHPRVN